MGRINDVTKWLVMNVNFVFSTVAVFSIGFVVFALSSEWGSLDRGFFLGGGLVALLFWLLVFLISLIGCIGVNRQTKRYGCWTGRRIMALYQLTLLLTIVGDIWAVTRLMTYVKSFEEADESLAPGAQPLPYDSLEASVADRFNQFFFSATTTCTDAKFIFFWSWVDDHCEGVVTQNACMGCGDYSITMCAADQDSCVLGEEVGDLSRCPYQLCRRGVLQYLIKYMRPAGSYVLAFTVFQVFLMLLSCLLICFTEKDSLQTVLIKTGTIARPEFDPRDIHHA
mmetsp:Transcript_16061/g.26945  ORF Transcript_16061/g.26945 Transcript_16061/m.26945 type:complete len:282 (-) Transcript_16061:2515-3360(-)|eukprot:CAMPEP_0114431056 /NCGR_PEP_ID=MMETSP0103-20121206/10388_1 /TAXON_ID=37642 ORGANISM="Paraphysomonas imperforata, Strain PA2" /NCGR_SAMPLE_ID=MMETSP0103 /ASSEMBLY_ACC=CAM_ASM_000201 /LENGTH=281 /DNA_ID=CAMNT_0001600579 /DNA_START=82 /DNA_END=927 /DNA_ORIENTATION=+